MDEFKYNDRIFTNFRLYNNEVKSLQVTFRDNLYWFRIYNCSSKKIRWIVGKSLSSIDSLIISPSEYTNIEREYQMYIRKHKFLKIYDN